MKKKSILPQILTISLPITLQMLTQFALQFTDMAFVGHYNKDGLAAINLVGKFTGAKDKKNVLRAGNTCVLIALFVCAAVAVLYTFWPQQIVGIFSPYTTIINKLTGLVFMIILISFPKAVNVVITNSIKGTGNTRWSLFTQLPGTVSVILLAYIFMFVFKLELLGLFIAILIDELWRAVVNYLKFFLSSKKISLKALIKKVRLLFSYSSAL